MDKFPRRFDFNIISPHDILNRTINETHKAVLPEETEYRLFRNPKNCSNEDDDEPATVEVKDPRRNSSQPKLSSSDLIGSYQNVSSLTRIEQTTFFEDVKKSQDLRHVEHNPEFLIESKNLKKKLRLLPNLVEKKKVEMANFMKSAEIVYYQQLSNHARVLDENATQLLVETWNQNRGDQKYSIITKLMRDQKFDDEIRIDIEKVDHAEITASRLPHTTKFPQINKLSIEDLKMFSSKLPNVCSPTINAEVNLNVTTMSAATLFKLFVDSESFQVKFSNSSTESGKTVSKFAETFPSNPVEITESLQTFAHLSLKASFNIENFKTYLNKNISHSNQQHSDYNLTSISDFFKKFYERFESSSKSQQNSSARYQTRMKFFNQEIVIQYERSDFYFKDDTSNVPLSISIKLEYQTSHGAEVMTREELLREWCYLKFHPGSELLRFRIDAASFNILSRESVCIEQIESQLHEIYNTKTENVLKNMFNTILCINRLPPNEYLMVGSKNQQILIYMENDARGDALLSEPWKISQNISRKWIPVDEKFITFLHLNHQIPPCSFYEPNIHVHMLPTPSAPKRLQPTNNSPNKPPNKKPNYNLRLPKSLAKPQLPQKPNKKIRPRIKKKVK